MLLTRLRIVGHLRQTKRTTVREQGLIFHVTRSRLHGERSGLDEFVNLVDNALAVKINREYIGQILHEDLGELESAHDDFRVIAGQHGRYVTGHGQIMKQIVQKNA